MLAIFFPGWEMQETGSLAHIRVQDSTSATTGNRGQAPGRRKRHNQSQGDLWCNGPGQRKRPHASSTRPLSLHFNTWQNQELCLNDRHYEEGSR
jgi:hypothetical protein